MKRRGFDHWLGQNQGLMPRPLSPDNLKTAYEALRHSAVPEIVERTANSIITSHIRIGMGLVGSFLVRSPGKSDVFVSEMMWGLVRGCQRLREGAIDHHSDPNITGYLVKTVTGCLRKVACRDRLLGVHEKTYRKGKHGIVVPLHGHDFEHKKGETAAKELLESILYSCGSESERRIVQLRVAEHTDEEIGEILGLTKARVQQIRAELRKRVMETPDVSTEFERNRKGHNQERK